MALIPADMAAHFSMQQHTQQAPTLSQLSNLDQQMKSILEDSTISTDVKFKQYYNTLHRYGALKENAEQAPIPVKIQENSKIRQLLSDDDDSDLLAAVPLAQKRGARLLLKYVRENPEMQWNEAKELIYNGVRIPHSNIVDLISDTSRNRKTAVPAIGWQEFADALMAQNVPENAIGNKNRWEYIARRGAPNTSFSTPSTSRGVQRRNPLMRYPSESSGSDFQPTRKTRKKGRKQIGSGRLRWDRLY